MFALCMVLTYCIGIYYGVVGIKARRAQMAKEFEKKNPFPDMNIPSK